MSPIEQERLRHHLDWMIGTVIHQCRSAVYGQKVSTYFVVYHERSARKILGLPAAPRSLAASARSRLFAKLRAFSERAEAVDEPCPIRDPAGYRRIFGHHTAFPDRRCLSLAAPAAAPAAAPGPQGSDLPGSAAEGESGAHVGFAPRGLSDPATCQPRKDPRS